MPRKRPPTVYLSPLVVPDQRSQILEYRRARLRASAQIRFGKVTINRPVVDLRRAVNRAVPAVTRVFLLPCSRTNQHRRPKAASCPVTDVVIVRPQARPIRSANRSCHPFAEAVRRYRHGYDGLSNCRPRAKPLVPFKQDRIPPRQSDDERTS